MVIIFNSIPVPYEVKIKVAGDFRPAPHRPPEKNPALRHGHILYLESFLSIFLASFQLKSGVRIRSVSRAAKAFTANKVQLLFYTDVEAVR